MYTLNPTPKFEKDYKLCKKRGFDLDLINDIFEIPEETGILPEEYQPHILRGNYANHLECHIEPDWLLIWIFNKDKKEIRLIRTGTHNDLFKLIG